MRHGIIEAVTRVLVIDDTPEQKAAKRGSPCASAKSEGKLALARDIQRLAGERRFE